MYTDGNFFEFFESPIAAVFIGISAIVVVWTIIKQIRKPKTA